jgi:hypothetical protein
VIASIVVCILPPAKYPVGKAPEARDDDVLGISAPAKNSKKGVTDTSTLVIAFDLMSAIF